MVTVPVGEVADAIARIARPLGGDREFDQLIELVASRRIVLLGEAIARHARVLPRARRASRSG